jgi:fucose permease
MLLNPPSRRITTLATIGAYLCLFLLGFTDNLKGPTLPALLGDLRLDYAQGAAILLTAQIGFTLSTLAAGVLAFFLPLSGLFYAIIFPTTTAAVSSYHPENVNTIVGLLLTAAGIGGALGSGSVGFASNQVGIALGFGVTTLYSLLMVVAAFFLSRMFYAQAR